MMRRNEREVKDKNRILQILEECKVCRLAFSDDHAPYIVPLNFGYETDGNMLSLYFHCAKEGRKIELIKRSSAAAFETDFFRRLVTADQACGYTAQYSSITGFGDVEILTDSDQKLKGLCAVMRHYTGSADWQISQAAIDAVCVLKLTVKGLSCMENLT